MSARSVGACGTGGRALPRHCQSKAPWRICQAGRDRVPTVSKNIGRRGLRSSRRAITGPVFSIAEDGDPVERREPRHGRAQKTVPLPGAPIIEGMLRYRPVREEPRACDLRPAGTGDGTPPGLLPIAGPSTNSVRSGGAASPRSDEYRAPGAMAILHWCQLLARPGTPDSRGTTWRTSASRRPRRQAKGRGSLRAPGATANPKRTSLGARRLALPEALSVSNLCALCVSGV